MREARSRLVCERVRSQISLGLDGELSELEAAMVASHVARCGACAEYERDVSVLTQTLRSADLEPLQNRVQLPSRRRLVSFRNLQVAAAGAAVLAAVALGGMSEVLRSHGAANASLSPTARLDAVDELHLQRGAKRPTQGPVVPI